MPAVVADAVSAPCRPTTGAIEFQVRAVSGGLVSTAMVDETRPGDRWRLSSPHGGLHVDRDAGGRADGGRQHRAGAAAGDHHGPDPVRH